MSNGAESSAPSNSRDWEDSNKMGFVLIVQTLVITHANDDVRALAGRIMFQAMRIRKADIPMDLSAAAKQFLDWAAFGDPQPDWIKSPLPISGIAGL